MLNSKETFNLKADHYAFNGWWVPQISFGVMSGKVYPLDKHDQGYLLPWRVFSGIHNQLFSKVQQVFLFRHIRLPIGIYELELDHGLAVLK